MNLKCGLLIALLFGSASSQIKIGDIEISEKMAMEYFLDCYQHPDTVTITPFWSSDKDATRRYKEIVKKSLYEVKPTKAELKKNAERDWEGEKIPYSKRGIPYRYAIARQPSADDFSKWFINRRKGVVKNGNR